MAPCCYPPLALPFLILLPLIMAYDDYHNRDENFNTFAEVSMTWDNKERGIAESQFSGLGHQGFSGQSEYVGFNRRPSNYFASMKKKKKKGGKRFKYMMPMMMAAASKMAQMLPVAKLTLLALFALVLFAKKAFLVSAASLILVIYDAFLKGRKSKYNVLKDRGGTNHDQGGEVYLEEVFSEKEVNPWDKVEGYPAVYATRLSPRDSEETRHPNWKRWWTPQVKPTRKIDQSQSTLTDKLNDFFPAWKE